MSQPDQDAFKPYVAANQSPKELTFKAILLGVIMAAVLGAANAYLGLKAGMTVAATFPAAVISMAILRAFKGTILEENIARTTGAVGEALAARAIFTIPAFIMTGVWTKFDYLTATLLLLVGGVLGVLLVILLRRTFMEDRSLPFPESQACTEIVKAGQKGSSGAGTVFTAMGIAALIEFFKNANGISIVKENIKGVFQIGDKGTFPYVTPTSSPAFLGVGFIIGPRLAAITDCIATPFARNAAVRAGAVRSRRLHGHQDPDSQGRYRGALQRHLRPPVAGRLRRCRGGLRRSQGLLLLQHQDDRHRGHDRGCVFHPLQDA